MSHAVLIRAVFFFVTFPLAAITQAGEMSSLNMPKEARDTLMRYSAAVVKADVDQVHRYLHPLLLKSLRANGKSIAKTYKEWSEKWLLPDREEFGDAESFGSSKDRLYIVPSVRIQKGFPDDIRQSHLYVVTSADAGKSWKIFDNDCGINEKLIKKLVPDYKGEPSLVKMREKAEELANYASYQSLQ